MAEAQGKKNDAAARGKDPPLISSDLKEPRKTHSLRTAEAWIEVWGPPYISALGTLKFSLVRKWKTSPNSLSST